MRVLLVEDADELAEATQRRLARSGLACDRAGDVADARACLATTEPYEDGVDYYVAYCDLIYVFVNTDKGWRFEGVSVND